MTKNLTDLSNSEILKSCNSIIEGEFLVALKSGRVAKKYVDIDPLLARPSHLDEIAKRLARKVSMSSRMCPPSAITCPAVGAIPLMYCFERHFPPRGDMDFAAFAEKVGDDFSLSRRGFKEAVADKRVLIVEDITTTGESALRTAKQVIEAGGQVSGFAFIWNRSPEKINASLMGAPVESLISEPVESWLPDECPDWGTLPLVQNLGHPSTYPNYPGPIIEI